MQTIYVGVVSAMYSPDGNRLSTVWATVASPAALWCPFKLKGDQRTLFSLVLNFNLKLVDCRSDGHSKTMPSLKQICGRGKAWEMFAQQQWLSLFPILSESIFLSRAIQKLHLWWLQVCRPCTWERSGITYKHSRTKWPRLFSVLRVNQCYVKRVGIHLSM